MKPPVVWRESGEKITLQDADWLGAGGEGSVWRVDSKTAVKVASDPAAYAVKAQKTRLLAAICHPSLVTPTGLALDASGRPIGHFMPLAPGEPLARYFSTAWQGKRQIRRADLIDLADHMRQAIERLHAEGVIGGDINEFNWVVDGSLPRLFDCDSWGVGGLPVSAMLPSIADPAAKGRYGQGSDWFAFAVLVFQLFIGAHPYRGSHPDFGRQDLNERMAQGASLFDPKASAPASARDLDSIPAGLRRWMSEVLGPQAHRSPPPPKADWERPAAQAPSPAAARRAPAAGALRLAVQETLRLPCAFSRWIGPGLALLADGSALDLASRSRLDCPGGDFGLRLPDGAIAWARFDPASGALSARALALESRFNAGAGARAALLQGRLFLIKPASWQEIAIQRLGPSLLLAPRASGAASLREASVEEGGILAPSLGGSTLLRPAPGAGLGLSPLRAPASPGARLIGSASAPGFDAFAFRNGAGEERSALFIRGKAAGEAPSLAASAHAIGPQSALCLFDSNEAALINLADGSMARGPIDPLWQGAQSFAGALWAPSPDGLSVQRAAFS